MTAERTSMQKRTLYAVGAALVAGLVPLAGCSNATSSAAEAPRGSPAPVAVSTVRVTEATLTRTFRTTGTLLADEQAEVSAESAGRVVATPVERGTVVSEGTLLVQVSPVEAGAQLAEAEANAAQVAAALALGPDGKFEVEHVPDVANARAELELAEAEYARIKSLLDDRVVSQSEYDQRRTRVEAARQAYEAARNGARQRYRSYEAARARVALAKKGLSDTSVRAPFAGVVGERRVSVGDYVTKGTPVATVVRIDPLRVELAIAEQDVARVRTNQAVSFRVDAYPDRTFAGTVRYVSPALRADQRALTVEAVVANPTGELKPGLFATAEVSEPGSYQALLAPREALRDVGSTVRILVVKGDRLEDRIVTTGHVSGGQVEILTGLNRGEIVALPNGQALAEGTLVRATPRATSSGTLAAE